MHLTTLSPPALLGDLLLVWLCHKASVGWGEVSHDRAMTSLYLWMFTSKWIKLLGHYIRYPVDVFLLPVSILFGYFHGAIKMYAVMTLNVVSQVCFHPLSPLFISRVFFFWEMFYPGYRGQVWFCCSGRRGREGKVNVALGQPLLCGLRLVPSSSLGLASITKNALIMTPPSCRWPYPLSSRASHFPKPWLSFLIGWMLTLCFATICFLRVFRNTQLTLILLLDDLG